MDTNTAEALAFIDGLRAANGDLEDEDIAHLWRIRQRDIEQRADSEDRGLAQRLAALPPATTPASWPPFEPEAP